MSEDVAEEIVFAAERTTVGDTAIEYDRLVDGRPLAVVVVRDSSPPLVITVMARRAG